MSDGVCTRCGHDRWAHHKPTMREPRGCGLINCECFSYTVAVLPEGERLEFGKHRLEQGEAETAPAWPPLS